MIALTDTAHVLEYTRDDWETVRGERIFITGATGFVGTWLLETFAAANQALKLDAQVVALTRDPDAFARKAPHVAGNSAVVMQAGNTADFCRPGGQFAFIIHAATERCFKPDAQRPLGIFDADLQATRRILEFARGAGTRALLFTSSGAVYGRQPPDLTHVSEDYLGAPAITDIGAAYGEGKRVSEYMCLRYAEQFGFVAIAARLFAFVGPYLPLDDGYAVGNFIGDALARRPISIAGDGTPLRSYLYAADLAIWLWRMLLGARSNRVYNVGSAEAVSIIDLARAVGAASEVELPIAIAQPALATCLASRYVPDISRARGELGLDVFTPLRQALQRTFAWHRRAVAV